MSVETMDNRMVGRGELLVEQKLLEQGWHPVRLDTAQMMQRMQISWPSKKSSAFPCR